MPGDRCSCLSRRADRHRDVAGSRTGRASGHQHPVFLCRGAVARGSHGTWDDGAPLVVRRRQNGSICAQVPCWGGPGASRKFESNLEGEAKGVYNATFYATITMLVKPDRTIDYEVRQIHTTSDGDIVLVYYKGTSIIESPTQNKLVGETTFQASSKNLAWLNGIKARYEGEYNPVTGENDFQVYGKR